MKIATPEQVAAFGGLRWGELAALRRRDVDLGHNAISVRRKRAEVTGSAFVRPAQEQRR